MFKTPNLQYNTVSDLTYETDGHRYISLPLFYDKSSYSNTQAEFIFDTGAYLTVLSQETAVTLGYDKITPIAKNIPLTGFADSKCEGDLIEIPAMLIGGRKLEDVKVAVPYVDIEDDILGLNVLECFNYLIDSTNDKIYFSDNPIYKAQAELKHSRISIVSVQ
ncbi:MAG: retroviral-like aspartic protease family protein [Oscillospiraceae bacterium]|jgi:predicted aspartyl protease|nr:retroviral-like aspartic protease family protein [Oscillospiraceae bacterium]